MSALVFSHLDYCNSILAEAHDHVIMILQGVQNMASKIVLGKGKYSSVTESMRELHWLPVHERMLYKTLCIVWKSIHNQSPKYLQSLICKNTGCGKDQRSNSSTDLLIIPWVKNSSCACRSFSVFSPREWNTLPDNIRRNDSFETFKVQLKTHLLATKYMDNIEFCTVVTPTLLCNHCDIL